MSTIRTYPLQNSAILRLNADRDAINVAPEYQRRGDAYTQILSGSTFKWDQGVDLSPRLIYLFGLCGVAEAMPFRSCSA